MRLAPDDIVVSIGNQSIELRPSLRAATRLAQHYAGLAPILTAILDGNVTIMADLIREGADTDTDIPDLLEDVGARGLGITLDQLAEPLVQFVLALAGHDDTAAPTTKASGKPMPFADYHKRLFSIATGWLGWSPADAWHATPAEIIAAYDGRLEMLKAIYGSNEESPVPAYAEPVLNADGTDPEFDRAGLHELKSMTKVLG
jgi:hypothetical protein